MNRREYERGQRKKGNLNETKANSKSNDDPDMGWDEKTIFASAIVSMAFMAVGTLNTMVLWLTHEWKKTEKKNEIWIYQLLHTIIRWFLKWNSAFENIKGDGKYLSINFHSLFPENHKHQNGFACFLLV